MRQPPPERRFWKDRSESASVFTPLSEQFLQFPQTLCWLRNVLQTMHGSIAITQDDGAKGNHSSNNPLLYDNAFNRIKENVRGSFIGLTRLPDISNNVGSVKSFLSALLRSLLRVVFLVPSLTSASTTTARS
jgi:hypothetical protein